MVLCKSQRLREYQTEGYRSVARDSKNPQEYLQALIWDSISAQYSL